MLAVGANTPVAMMLYSGAAQLPLGPTVPTVCIVERTLGDRRLRTHVLAGLDLLLPLLINIEKFDSQAVLRAFPLLRPLNDEGDEHAGLPLSTQRYILDHTLHQKPEFYVSTLGDYPGPRDATTMLNLSHLSAAAAAAAAALRASEQPPSATPQQMTNEGSIDMYAKRYLLPSLCDVLVHAARLDRAMDALQRGAG